VVSLSGNITSNGDVHIRGYETAAQNITISAGTVTVDGNQTAENGNISVTGGSLTVNSNQKAGQAISVSGTSEVVVTGFQIAKTDITLTNSSATVGSQTAETGSITVTGTEATTDNAVKKLTITSGDQTAAKNITITNTELIIQASTTSTKNSQIARDGDISITNSHFSISGNQVAGGNITLNHDNNQGSFISGYQQAGQAINIDGSQLAIAGNQTAGTNISILDSQSIYVGGSQTATTGEINLTSSTVTIVGNQIAKTDIAISGENTRGNSQANVTITAGNQIAETGSVYLDNSTLNITGDQTANQNIVIFNGANATIFNQTAENGEILIVESTVRATYQVAGRDIIINGSTVTVGKNGQLAKTGEIVISSSSTVTIEYGNQIAQNGSITVNASTLNINNNYSQIAAGNIIIDSSAVSVGSQSAGGDINISNSTATTVKGDMEADGRISLQSEISDSFTGTTTVNVGGNVYANGSTIQKSKLSAQKNITLTGTNTIADSNIEAIGTDSELIIQTGTASDDITEITNSTVKSTGTLSIIGTENSQALVKNSVEMRATGSNVTNANATAITLENVKFENDSLKTITAQNGNILIRGTVDMTATALSVNSGKTVIPTDSVIGTIMLGEDATLNMHNNALLDGTLSSRGETATIVKDGGDVLKLDFSAREYNGTINVLANDGSEFVINSDGLGMNAKTNLKDTNFTVTPEAYTNATDGTVQIGSIDTTADTSRRTAAQLALQVVNENSYIGNDNTRLDFSEMGTVLTFGKGTAGNKTVATNLSLNSHTVFTAEHTLNTDGSITADTLTVNGVLDAKGARVFGTIINDTTANEAAIADNTRVRIVSLEGENASVASAFSEEMLYDFEFNEATGTYQRTLKNLNAHVETTADGVDIVYTKNYRSVEGKTENQEEVANVLIDLTDNKNLATGSELERLLKAFNSTQSSTAALNALTSVNGATNTIAMHALLDSSRHHLEALRKRIALPLGAKTNTTIPELGGAIWADYTGGYDMQNGDSNVGEYTRTHQSLMAGWHAQVNENFLIGVSVGYENSISRNDATKFNGDTNFADLYASARTGRFNHRLSIGVADHSFKTSRYVSVSAAATSFSGEATGTLDGDSFNVGYELSTDFELAETMVWSPFASVNYAHQSLDDLTEEGLGDAGLKMSYNDITQVDIGIGARLSQSIAIFDNQHPMRIVLSVALRAELNDEDPEATAAFLGDLDNTYRVKAQERETLYVQLGAGISMPFADNWCATATCNGEFGEDRAGIAGSLGLAYTF